MNLTNHFELYVTGYNEDGSPADPVFLGDYISDCFENAVIQFKQLCSSPELVDLKRMTFWGKPIYNGIEQLKSCENLK